MEKGFIQRKRKFLENHEGTSHRLPSSNKLNVYSPKLVFSFSSSHVLIIESNKYT